MKKIDLTKIKYKHLNFFRFKKLGQRYLLTNDIGRFILLNEENFKNFLEDKLDKKSEVYASLLKSNFAKGADDVEKMAEAYSQKNVFLNNRGPSLHIVIPTLRCTHKCVYCHASAQDLKRKGLDMDEETARLTVDAIFQSPNQAIAIEFQGGEPLVNWKIVKFIVDYSRQKNEKAKKSLELRLVSNMSLMTQKRFDYLLDKKVNLCTSLDGPEFLHNQNRPATGRNSHQDAVKWIKKFNKIYPQLREKGYVGKMGALLTISRASLAYWKEIVDEYLGLGFDNVYFRFLNPFGFTQDNKSNLYSAEEYLDFYRKVFTYILDLNAAGKKMAEVGVKFFLIKIFSDRDPNHLDFRSPCGAGIGQLAYNYNGDVYTCDEGRMFSMMGDETFRLGNIKKNGYSEIVGNPVVRTMCTASCLDGVAGCSDCVYKPYCGSCPVYNYFVQGNIFGQMPNNERCRMTKGMFDILFEKLQDAKDRELIGGWLNPPNQPVKTEA